MKHTKDMTKRSPLSALILFSLPLILGNLFQHFYNLMDIAIVGNNLGDYALTAVGATSALYGLYISLTFGFTNGFSLTIAHQFGAGNIPNVRKNIAHSLKLSLLVALSLTAVSSFTTRPLLTLLQTPDIDLSYRYISVILFGLIFTVTYNMFSAILRAVGNSLAPLIFLIIGSLSNVAMDFIFIKFLNMGVFGAGLATVLAQAISSVLSAVYFFQKCKGLIPTKEELSYDGKVIRRLIANGVSMGLMFSIVSIGSITLQYAVNSLGPDTIAAHTTARKIDEMMMLFFFPLSTASATFCSQNYGAGKIDRIKKGILTAFAISTVVSCIMITVTYLFGENLVRMISGSSNEELIRLSTLYLKCNIPFFFFLFILVILRSSLQGIGNKILPITASLTELGGKVIASLIFVPLFGYLGIIFCEPVIWIVGAIIVGITFLVTIHKLNRNKVSTADSL
ncbi:MAG: MATE family efflux transporter [Lachnospiraceae bacterium]|nr:MATE family efflux transporter [Lachnospiraceae bacterium]